MAKNIPTYSITLEDVETESGHFMDKISIVKNPAIMATGFRFSKVSEIIESKVYFAEEQDQQFIIAPVAIPNLEIFRRSEDLGEYNVVFSEKVIAQLLEDFQSNPIQYKINMDHQTDLKSAFVTEIWLIEDTAMDKSVKYGFSFPVGTMMAKVKVKDKAEWEMIKEGDRASFSLEAWLGLAMEKFEAKLRAQMEKHTYAAVKTATGEEIWVDGELAVDSNVYCNEPTVLLINDQRSEIKYPVWTNIVELEDGKILTIAEGKIVQITQKESTSTESGSTKTTKTEMAKQKFADVSAKDGSSYFVEGEIAIDSAIFTYDENRDKQPAADGDIILEDESTITVKDGKITAITPKEEMADAPVAEAATIDEAAVMAIIQPKLDEIIKAIADLKTLVEADSTEDAVEDSSPSEFKSSFREMFKQMNKL